MVQWSCMGLVKTGCTVRVDGAVLEDQDVQRGLLEIQSVIWHALQKAVIWHALQKLKRLCGSFEAGAHRLLFKTSSHRHKAGENPTAASAPELLHPQRIREPTSTNCRSQIQPACKNFGKPSSNYSVGPKPQRNQSPETFSSADPDLGLEGLQQVALKHCIEQVLGRTWR